MTLLETLAAITLAGLLTAAVAGGLLRSDGPSRLAEARSEWIYQDQTARSLAERQGPLLLRAEGKRLELVCEATGTPLRKARLAARVKVRISAAAAEPTSSVRYNRLGCTLSYTVTLASGNAQTQLNVSGTTGWVTSTEGRRR
ncbi:MAG: hypothetical protein AAGB48_10500 [Planctomycetota bacterium]